MLKCSWKANMLSKCNGWPSTVATALVTDICQHCWVQDLTADCSAKPDCSGLAYNNFGCCGDPIVTQSGWLKQIPEGVSTDCVQVSPYTTFYVRDTAAGPAANSLSSQVEPTVAYNTTPTTGSG